MINNEMNINGLKGINLPGLTDKTEETKKDMSFQDLLKGLVDQVDSLQKEADVSIEGLVTGETTDIHDVTIKMQEAGIAFDLMMEIRNKLIEAYQQIIKMQS